MINLEYINLNKTEFKVYKALLNLGISSAQEISNFTNIPRSTVHNCLNKLISKEFVTKLHETNVKKYMAKNPEFIKKILYNKEQSIQTDLENINNTIKEVQVIIDELQEDSPKLPTVEYFEGLKGVRNAYLKIIKNTKTIKTYANANWVTEQMPEIRKFYRTEILKGNLTLYSIFIDSKYSEALEESFDGINKNYYVKKILSDLGLRQIDYTIFDKGVAIFSYKKFPTATIHFDMQLRNHAEAIYDHMWRTL